MDTDNNKISSAISKYALIALAVSAVLIAGSTWVVYSLNRGVSVIPTAAKPDLPIDTDKLTPVRDYNPDPPINIDPQTSLPPPRAVVTVTQIPDAPKHHQSVKRKVNRSIQAKKDDNSLHDMFPVGKVTNEQSQVQEPTPKEAQSFTYGGKTWSSTGNYITADQADLVPTGDKLEDGRQLYSLGGTDTSDEDMIFVQSTQDPDDFAIYESS